jgi:hypothetical protein
MKLNIKILMKKNENKNSPQITQITQIIKIKKISVNQCNLWTNKKK